MFIYDQGHLEPGITNQLASVTDLRNTALRLLFPDREPLPQSTPFSGIDLFREKRDLVFSQNMFALQEDKPRFIREMNAILTCGHDAIHLHTICWNGFLVEKLAMERRIPRVIVHAHATMADIYWVRRENVKMGSGSCPIPQ